MRDDLFEFLAAQEAGRAVQETRRAAEHAKRGAEGRSLVDKIKARQRTERQQPRSGNVSI